MLLKPEKKQCLFRKSNNYNKIWLISQKYAESDLWVSLNKYSRLDIKLRADQRFLLFHQLVKDNRRLIILKFQFNNLANKVFLWSAGLGGFCFIFHFSEHVDTLCHVMSSTRLYSWNFSLLQLLISILSITLLCDEPSCLTVIFSGDL